MLRWLHQDLSPNARFFFRTLAISVLFHAVGCFLLLFVYAEYNSNALLQVRANSSEAIVKLVPFGTLPSTKSIQSSPQGLLGKSLVPKTTMVKKVGKKKAVQKKQVVAKKKQSLKKSKEVPKKNGVEKKVKKIEQKKETVPVKEKSAPEPIAQKNDQPVSQDILKPILQEALVDQPIQEVTFKEFELVQLQESLQEAVARVWTPPAGMSEELMCQVSLTIGWDGILLERVIEVSSGVFVYDIAVEQALDELQMPSELWGKKLKIVFKP